MFSVLVLQQKRNIRLKATIASWLQEQVSRLQRRLAEAEAAEAARKKAQAEEEKEKEKEEDLQAIAPVQEGQGNVINEWVCHY
jgi:septal ring factor EnvC (AmiA/AmiB activator)